MVGSTFPSTGRDGGKRSSGPNTTNTSTLGRQHDVSWLPNHLREAVKGLLNAYRYAQHVRDDVWDFGVELESLNLTLTDVRWLLRAGYVDCAIEVTLPGESERSFRHCNHLTVSDSACLVLTQAGVEFAERLENQSAPASMPRGEHEQNGVTMNATGAPTNGTSKLNGHHGGITLASRPKWDRNRQELRMGNVVVKRFKAPAHNQETVLAAFEEDDWPDRIDDPLPPVPELEPKRRLHDTINSLNRNQKHQLIRFLGDGSGQGILWEPLKPKGFHES